MVVATGYGPAGVTANADQSPANLGKVEVTGTRIKRTDVETSQPITRLSRKQLESTGLTTVGDLLQNITSAGSALSTLDNFAGNFKFTGGGQTNVDPRYLGAKRVLVLVNGRRWIKSLGGTVDLSTIPLSIVDHIEVLQDGASAIYGSDAIAGVVNIITEKNFNGKRLSGHAGAYKASGESFDGAKQAYNFTFGRTSDNSSLLWNVSYTKQNAIYARNRDISKEPVFDTGNTRGSSSTPQGRFRFIPTAGPLGVAFGYQYRKQDGFFQPDALAVAGLDSYSPGIPIPPTSGSTQVNSEYIEFDVPLLSDLPGANRLDVDGATRHSNYSSFGGTTTSRVGVKYQPMHDLLIRASWSQGFRAPNINELFAGKSTVDTFVQDPCSNYTQGGVSSAVQQNCAAAGVPASYTQNSPDIGSQQGGNPDLNAESSISKTIGFVYSPSWLPGLGLNADYYRIDLEGTIQPNGEQNIFDDCYISGNQDDCERIIRNSFGDISRLNNSQTNIGGTFTDGVDAELRYKFPSTSIGDFTIDAKGTYIRTFQQFFPTATGGRKTTNLVGIERGGIDFPFGIPRYKSRFDTMCRGDICTAA